MSVNQHSDLLPKNLVGRWTSFDWADIFWIKDLDQINLDHVFLALNMGQNSQIFDSLHQIPHHVPVIISCHVEYFWHRDLSQWFQSRPNQKFLLLSDWVTYDDIWPSNVTPVRWITWHHQLETIASHHGIANTIRQPQKKISSLAHVHEYHKAVVTAYLLERLPRSDMEISWWDVRFPGRMYYLDPDFSIHPRIANYVISEKFQTMLPIRSSGSPGSPLHNADWQHPAYVSCAVNLTNESVFNAVTMIDDQFFKLPGPYLTEKTWKPILSGCAFIPVGQPFSLRCLEDLGCRFGWLENYTIDSISNEDDRLLAIMDFLDAACSMTSFDLWQTSLEDTQHNLDHVRSGAFAIACHDENQTALAEINRWVLDSDQ